MLGFRSPSKPPQLKEDTFKEIRAALQRGEEPTKADWNAFALNLYDRLAYHEYVCTQNGYRILAIVSAICAVVLIDSDLAKTLWGYISEFI